MKVLVAIKRVVDPNVKIRVKTDNSQVDLNNIKMAMNPFCEIAVEEAVRMKEAGVATEVIVVSIGPKEVKDQLFSALAIGADRAVWVESQESLNPLGIANILKKIVIKEEPSIVLLGKQAIDSDNNQTGQMLAALCGYPQATFASKIVVSDCSADVTREVDGGLQSIKVELPAVITTDLRLNEPRYVKLPDIMKAKRKPLKVISLDELQIKLKPGLMLLKVEDPIERTAGIKVKSVDELIDCLKNQAKVL